MQRNSLEKILIGITFLSLMASLYAIFFYAPLEATMGLVQKVWYFHLASAWVTFLAYAVVFVAGILYLSRKKRCFDILGYSSAGIGVVFNTLVLVTGSIWAKPIWGTWWTWDSRLSTTLILWLMYIAYLMLRTSSGEDSKGARLAAVFGIVAFIDVPIVYMSIRWWRTIHPLVFKSKGTEVDPAMLTTLLISLVAFTLLYLCLLRQRIALEHLKDELERVKEKIRR
ncbi:MAG: cytochrome c biogenesis protein CcsA [Nitrospirae bacterium]|nr:cytochrome c biogenesis protein CcsA [Nitrospirota bacterium]